jgi:hypothetical protein
MSTHDERTKDQSCSDQPEENVTTITKVAPSTASEQFDRRAVRSRSRRERPRKLRPLTLNDDQANISAIDSRFDVIEPDIESFVSSCLAGVALPTSNQAGPRRSKFVHKRSLPSMSYLSAKTFAAAVKKRKKEEQTRQKMLAEEAAKKIMDSTMQLPDGNSDSILNENVNGIHPESNAHVTNTNSTMEESGLNSQNVQLKSIAHNETTTRIEGASNILMPPLLVDFLDALKKHKPKSQSK